MTRVGQLFNYSFDRESPRWNWLAVDGVLFEGHTLTGGIYTHNMLLGMIQEQFELPLQNVWRVCLKPSGLVELNDFTMPSNRDTMRESFRQEDLPQWVQDSLSVLMIVDQGVTVEGVGKKISDSVFYLMETPEIKEVYGDKT